MEIADLIAKEVNESCNDIKEKENVIEENNDRSKNKSSNIIGEIRKKIGKHRTIAREDFSSLVKYVENNGEEIVALMNLTRNEAQILASTLRKAKFRCIDSVIRSCIESKTRNKSCFLYQLLSKRCNLQDTRSISTYLQEIIRGNVYLWDLKVLLAVARNYPMLITQDIIKFAKEQNHPICKQIAKMAVDYD